MVIDLAPQQLTEDAARRLTERIRADLDTASQTLDRLAAQITQAHKGRADLALGYASWAEYAEEEFGQATAGLAAPIRQQLVGQLSGEGMSTRAIAPTVGTSHMQVSRDVRAGQVEHPVTPAAPLAPISDPTKVPRNGTPADGNGHISNAPPAPRTVTGLDGKTYTRPAPTPAPEPAKPRRRPLTDQAKDAGWELRSAVDRLQRLKNDDRFAKNREEIVAHIQGHLQHAIDVCTDLINN